MLSNFPAFFGPQMNDYPCMPNNYIVFTTLLLEVKASILPYLLVLLGNQ